jgi:site-specific DNA-methyltransferase (adenine-specific)
MSIDFENKLVVSDNIEYLKTLPDESIDMFIGSPPYDNLRDYSGDGYTLNIHGLGVEMLRTLKPGGVCVWVVQDACVKGTRTGSSFRTALDFMDTGFGLWETLIYQRRGVWNHKTRFRMDHEYIFVFSKGGKLAYFDKEHMKVPCKHPNAVYHGTTNIGKDGKRTKAGVIRAGEKKCNGTIFNYNFGGDGSKLKSKHPAVFPNLLALDFIECFCPPDGIVCDPYSGSGTSAVAAKSSGRRYLGIDISEEYTEIGRERVATEFIQRPVERKLPDTPNGKSMEDTEENDLSEDLEPNTLDNFFS